jgi:hypothetical protein
MATVAFFLKSAALASLFLLGLGIIEPWWVLWWKPTQNRLMVIRTYGLIALTCYLLALLIRLI